MGKPLLIEFGMGTSLRRGDYTEAAARGIRDALWRNSINLAELFGKTREDMRLCVVVGVQRPEEVDREALRGIFPYGEVLIHLEKGGLDVPREGGPPTVIANIAIKVQVEGVA